LRGDPSGCGKKLHNVRQGRLGPALHREALQLVRSILGGDPACTAALAHLEASIEQSVTRHSEYMAVESRCNVARRKRRLDVMEVLPNAGFPDLVPMSTTGILSQPPTTAPMHHVVTGVVPAAEPVDTSTFAHATSDGLPVGMVAGMATGLVTGIAMVPEDPGMLSMNPAALPPTVEVAPMLTTMEAPALEPSPLEPPIAPIAPIAPLEPPVDLPAEAGNVGPPPEAPAPAVERVAIGPPDTVGL